MNNLPLPRFDPAKIAQMLGSTVNTASAYLERASARGDTLGAALFPLVVYRITAPIEGEKGRYIAKWRRLGPKTDAAGDLIEDDVGELATVDEIEVWHLDDIGYETPTLSELQPGIGWFIKVDEDGKIIVLHLSTELPIGELQHMVLQNVTQNTIGYDFVMAHALP